MLRILAAVLLALAGTWAQAAITVDGRLDEPEWQQAQPLSDFKTTEPYTLAAPELKTTVLVHTDEHGLYFGFICDQPPAIARVRSKGQRDQLIPGDRVNLMLDFDGTGTTGYEFTAYLGGEKQDAVISRQLSYNYDWDGDWDYAASETGQQWFVEYRIPWTVAPMGAPLDGKQTIGAFFSRVVTQTGRRYSLPGNSFNRATFVADMREIPVRSYAQAQLDVFPYVGASRDVLDNGNDQRAGVDIFWKPNGQQQLTATVNPDFGQVEADELVVNFTAIPTLFPDKRPFFTENLGLFNTDVTVFYTRRIGAAPDAGPEGVSDILGALKYTGSSGSFDYGAVAALEDDSSIAKGRDFYVARARYRLSDSLKLGWLGTHVERPARDRLADVNAIDVAWTISPGVSLSGQGIISQVAQAAPGNFFNPTGTGKGSALIFRYAPGGKLEHTTALSMVDHGFNITDAGFQSRPSQHKMQNTTSYYLRDWDADSAIQEQSLNSNLTLRANDSGQKLFGYFTGTWETIRRDTRIVGLEYDAEVFGGVDDVLTRGNGDVRLPPRHLVVAYYKNPQAGLLRYLVVGGQGTGYFAPNGYSYFRIEPGLYPRDNLSFTSVLRLIHLPDELIWQGGSLLGAFKYEEEYLALDANWFPLAHHELRLKFQWVAASGAAVAAYRPNAHGNLSQTADPVGDFSFTTTALQLRYRYELAQLSELFVVYSHGGFDAMSEAESSVSSQFRRGFSRETDSQFLVKLRYRFAVLG